MRSVGVASDVPVDAGAEVVLISAPTALTPPVGAALVAVKTAAQMQAAVLAETGDAHALIMAAAVADFRPLPAAQKLKKETGIPRIELEATADILAAVSARKAETGFPKFTVGFAAESQDLLKNAQSKLERKRLDMIVANDILAEDAGFEVDTNRVVLLFADGRSQKLPVQEKSEIAEAILQQIIAWG